jgi:hypothetical protein
MSQNAVAAALLAQQNGQNTQFQQTLPDLLTDQNQNLPPNMQRQQIISGQVPTNEGIQTFGQLARQLSIDPLVLVHFLMDRSLTIDGAVHGPGTFFVGPNVTLQDLVTAAGGTSDWVDTKEIELISTQISALNASARTSHELVALNDPSQAGRLVRPHDEVRLHQIDTAVGAGSVTLQGQVRNPGV